MIDALEAEVREHGPVTADEMRPPLLGFDPVVAKLHDLTNQIISLRIEQGSGGAKHLKGPMLPMEIVDERLRKFAARKRADVIAQSQSRWSERHA